MCQRYRTVAISNRCRHRFLPQRTESENDSSVHSGNAAEFSSSAGACSMPSMPRSTTPLSGKNAMPDPNVIGGISSDARAAVHDPGT